MTIARETKQLEQTEISVTYETCKDFEFRKLKDRFQKSSISYSAVIKARIQKISNEIVPDQFCIMNQRIIELAKSLTEQRNEGQIMKDLMNKLTKQDEVFEQWKFLIFLVTCFAQILMLTVIFLVLFSETKQAAVNLCSQEPEIFEMIEATPGQEDMIYNKTF
jgi:hypothetical protein